MLYNAMIKNASVKKEGIGRMNKILLDDQLRLLKYPENDRNCLPYTQEV